MDYKIINKADRGIKRREKAIKRILLKTEQKAEELISLKKIPGASPLDNKAIRRILDLQERFPISLNIYVFLEMIKIWKDFDRIEWKSVYYQIRINPGICLK